MVSVVCLGDECNNKEIDDCIEEHPEMVRIITKHNLEYQISS